MKIREKRGDLRSIFAFVLMSILFSGIVLAIFAFPGGIGASETVLKAQTCNTENNAAVAGTFNGACTASSIDFNDGITQATTNANANRYQGLNMTSYNSSITNCGAITQVRLCYEWWFTGGTSTLSNCAIRVDADGGVSYTLASPSCPGPTANPGETCLDVTSLENWVCSDFFTASGTRAFANLEAQFATANRPLNVDSFYFNVTYTADNVPPIINWVYPLNSTYTGNVTTINTTITDTNLQTCWYSLNGGVTNTTFTCNANIIGLNSSIGSNTWTVYANDSYANTNKSSITFFVNLPPTISNISIVPSTIGLSSSLMVRANGVNDSNLGSLSFFCSETSSTPTDNSLCSGGGNLTNIVSPYYPSCSYSPNRNAGNYTVYCRVYDGLSYSSTVNSTYQVIGDSLITSVLSVEGDTTPSYFDTHNNGITEILVSGSSGMSCRWSSSDLAYGSMSSSCAVVGSTANCSVNDVASQGLVTRYVSCQDVYGNSQTASNNLNIPFYLDYTAPTTSDNSVSSVQLPPYSVTVSEADNVDSDPTSYYCLSNVQGCTPTTSIDNEGLITLTSANRGANYLRYYSVDDAGNSQTIVNKTININQLPVLSSSSDDVVIIRGGTSVSISTVSSDSDSGQTMNLYVCNSSSASSSGCSSGTYCSAVGTANLSCGFASESDTTTHNWYAYLYDALGEAASSNPIAGGYVTDSDAPIITLVSPLNTSYTGASIGVEVVTSESAASVWYNLDSNLTANISMTNISSTQWASTISALSLGSHHMIFYANDSYGNVDNSSTVYFIRVSPADSTPPAVTIISPSNASYQNPSSVLINVTSDEALNWSGYQLNSGSVINLSRTISTNWDIILSDLSQESTYNLTVYANDTSGNQNNKSSIFYTDSLAPRYSSFSVSPNPANQSQNVNCSVVWSDGFNINSVIISENSLGSYENHTISVSGNTVSASYLISGTKLANTGTYACVFYATDAAGNTNSTTVSFSVNDVSAPSLIVTSPNNATYNQQSISASLSTSENASAAWYSLNGGANVAMSGPTTLWSATISGLSNGAYSIKFYANDSSNNVGNSSTIYFSVDTGAVDTIAPVIFSNTISNASYIASTSLSFNISSNENLNWSGYTLNGGSLTSLSNISSVLWNGTLSGLSAESINTLIIYGNDSNNNQGNITLTFYSDNVPPRFLDISVIPNPANETQNVICNAYVNDTFSLASVKIGENATIPGVFLNHSADIISRAFANYTILNSQKGNFVCVFYATDAAGNTNSTTVSFSVNDITPPSININSPLNFTYTTDQIVFGITTSENVASANYSLDGGATNYTLSGSGTSWSASSVITSDGSKNVVFYAIDSSGNIGVSSRVFGIDTSVNDITPPLISVWSPISGNYYTSSSILLNITSDENLSWAGFTNNSGPLRNLGNISTINWNSTVVFVEGTQVLAFYANDTSSNKNQGNKNLTIYVDMNNPSVSSFTCSPNPANDHQEVSCSASVSDSVGLDYAIIEFNSSGVWQNSSSIDLSGTSDSFSFNITSGNTSIGSFVSILNVYDLSGRVNNTKQTTVSVLDDTFPTISNIVYSPTSADDLDPNVNVSVNATIVEDYSIGSVYLMYKEALASSWSSILMSNLSNVYNATFVPTNGTWQFKINATDMQGNQNVSSPTTLVVTTENSFYNYTDIPDVKSITFAQRATNTSLGYIHVSNTGDNALNFTISISSADISDRFDVNGSLDNNLTFELASGTYANLTVLVNTTSLVSNLYDYNIDLSSSVGSLAYEKKLYVQSEAAPYIVTSITKYSSTVTKGESGVNLSAKVTNFGTQEALNVSLFWSLPTEFSVTSGSVSKNILSLGIGESAAAIIEPVISVSSSSEEKYVNITVIANASNANSSSDSRQVVIGSPSLGSISSSGGGGTSGFAQSGGGQSVVYTKEIEVVRGGKNQFEIPVRNGYYATTMKDLKLSLSGFSEQYISITPQLISQLEYNQTGVFVVSLFAPSYKDYEVHDVKITITGNLISDNRSNDYTETQYVKLVIQEVSREQATNSLDEARKAIGEMKDKNFSTAEMENLLLEAENWLNKDKRYKNSLDISNEILNIRDTAFEAEDLLRRVVVAIQNPRKSSILVGNVVKDFVDYDSETPLNSLITGRAVFASSSIENVVSLGVAAFERGDYNSALSRAKEARNLLVLERKGNFLLFVYLYWPYILFAIFLISGTGILGYSSYQRANISRRIQDLNRKEDNVRILMAEAQKNYFSGKISNDSYHLAMAQNQNQLAKIKSERVKLGNIRVKVLEPQELESDLDKERREVESSVKKIQEKFYVNKTISDKEYGVEFNALNERLAEIEEEKTTVKLMERKQIKKDIKVENVVKGKGIFTRLGEWFERRKYKDEKMLKEKIAKMLEGKK